MKLYFLLLVFLITSIAIAQDNHTLNTKDGRRVQLKADFTWEYVDIENEILNATIADNDKLKEKISCALAKDFVEPKLDKKIQSQLRKGRATMSRVKKKVAKEYQCKIADVTLLSVSEIKSKAVYHFCVKGKEIVYKRIGNAIIKKEKFF